VTQEQLNEITRVSRAFDDLLNRASDRQAPYVGASAFATKAGIHASALAKDPATYEHVPPESVATSATSWSASRPANRTLLTALRRNGIVLDKEDPRSSACCAPSRSVRRGLFLRCAEASFVMLARDVLGTVPEFFEVESTAPRASAATMPRARRSTSPRRWSRSSSTASG